LVEAATDLQGLAYAHTSPEAIDVFKEQVLDVGIPVEIVFRYRMYENFKATYPEVVDNLITAGNYTAYVAREIPFGLFLLTIDGTDHVCLIVYDADQTLKGTIVNDTAEAVAWGTHLFNRYRNRATPVPQE
jgi:predicted transcriptional regulator